MTRIRLIPAALGAALLLGAGAVNALEVKEFAGGRYVSGGVGTDEQAEMQAMRPQFNLRVLTAQKVTGDFLANTRVSILKGRETLFETAVDGPMLMVALPPGQYTVRIDHAGKSINQLVDLGQGAREIAYHGE